MSDRPSPFNTPRWFDPRHRQAGYLAFILNRLSALGLTLYLGLHLVVLNKLAQGGQTYDDFVQFSQLPFIKAGEVILIAAVVFHGLNGLRLTVHAFGAGIRYQKQLFYLAIALAAFVGILFILRLFGG